MPLLSASSPPSPFPLYLLPSIPFRRRRRRSSALTTSTTSPGTSPSTSPSSSPPANASPSYLSTTTPTSHLRCHKCLTDLIPTSSIISKGFTGRHGRAYLVAPPPPSSMPLWPSVGASGAGEMKPGDLPNTHTHKPVPRQLVTGAHTVSDISCRMCGCVLGWKYVAAEEEGQRYKVGKFILETRRVVRWVGWEGNSDDEDEVEFGGGGGGGRGKTTGDEEIEFDSQDEDECEDLFSGMWSPELARRRRRRRDKVVGKGE